MAYYERIASECDILLARGPVMSSLEGRQLARQTNSLPPTIKELKPSHIQITTNAVELILNSYQIIWMQREEDHDLWTLVAYVEGHTKEVYSKRKRSVK